MQLKTQWDEFRALIGQRMPKSQELEAQRIFYAGAAAMFELMLATADGSDQQGEQVLNELHFELHSFVLNMGAPVEKMQ